VPHAPDLSGCALDDRYELHAPIGEGAFGRVYEGLDRRLARPVAVKVIKPWWTEDPEWVATFQRETQLLARVSDPGIVQIYDVGHADEGLYYVAELVDGENLADRLRRGPLPAWEACGVAAQLCRALAHAHARRIVHRDVKPANILLSSQGRVKVGDFGVARLAEGSTDGALPTIVGTPKYMAPEQGRGLPTTSATDVYSVGVVLYEMLAGTPPFSGVSVVELALSHLQEPPPPLPAGLPASLVVITNRALAKNPADRYADGAEMAEALADARLRSAGGRPEGVAATRARTGRPATRRMLVGAGAGGRGPGIDAPAVSAPVPIGAGGPPTPPPGRDATWVAPQLSRRRNVNPAGRRRAAAALAAVVALLAGMVVAAAALKPPARTDVPAFAHMTRAAARTAARRAHVTLAIGHRYSSAAVGIVIGQTPRARSRVVKGSAVHVTLSRGPAPVLVPGVRRDSLADAERSLGSFHLHVAVLYVPAPATAPGTVVSQTPAGDHSTPAGSTVHLSVAETPQWRPLTTFQGSGSGAVRIIGEHWRLVYSMAFQGTCTWIFWCSGPTARVINAGTGQTVASFGLSDGPNQSRTFATGPGTYEIQVTPGGDDARWSVRVDDDY